MELSIYDLGAFVGFIILVVAFALWASRKKKTPDDYFLAGRGLSWWLIGFSLIATNISMLHFVGMAGQGYQFGLAVAAFEWTAAVAMVLVALFLLPKFLRAGITTIPEYLKHRYSPSARGLMAFFMLAGYVLIAMAAILYVGSLSIKWIFGDAIEKALVDVGLVNRADIIQWGPDWLLVAGVWAVGIVAAIYTVWGGLKAVVWADLLNGVALIVGAIVVALLGFVALGEFAAVHDLDTEAPVSTFVPAGDVESEDTAVDSEVPKAPGGDADAKKAPTAKADQPADAGAKPAEKPAGKPKADAAPAKEPEAKEPEAKEAPAAKADQSGEGGDGDSEEEAPAAKADQPPEEGAETAEKPAGEPEAEAAPAKEPEAKEAPAAEADQPAEEGAETAEKPAVKPKAEAAPAKEPEAKEAPAAEAEQPKEEAAETAEKPAAKAAPAEEPEAKEAPAEEPEVEEAPVPIGAPPAAKEVDLAWHKNLVLGVKTFFGTAGKKLAAVRPFSDRHLPWLAVFLGGLWIAHFFYWGFNQSTMQRALGAKSVAQGQKGFLLAASLKLLIPVVILFPAIVAFQLYGASMGQPDQAYPHLLREILPVGLRGLMLAVLFGAVLSSLDSMLNSASTIFTMDLYKGHLKKNASDRSLVTIGRLATLLFVVIACLLAPLAAHLGGGSMFSYLQKLAGFISPGVVTAFLIGLCCKRAPAPAALGAMLLGIPVYGWLLWLLPDVAFLHHMALTFIALGAYMMLVTILMPLRDVAESSEQAESPPAGGFVRRFLVPYGTAFLGGLLLAVPVFVFSHVVTAKHHLDLWVHLTSTGVVLLIYVAVTLSVLRSPTPAVRKVVAEAAKPSFLRRAGRWVLRPLLAVIVAAVVGLHVYLFATWLSGKLPLMAETTPALKPCVTFLEPYMTESFEISIPAILLERPPARVLNVPPEPVREFGGEEEEGEAGADEQVRSEDEGAGGAKEEADEAEGEAGAEGGQVAPRDLPPPGPAWPHLEQTAMERAPIGGGFIHESRTMPIFYVPLVLAGLVVALFLVGLIVIWCQPAPGEAALPKTDKIDLTPSVVARVWGLVIIIAVGVLYWFFF